MVDAGEPAGGLGRGLRLYFASDDGLRSVSRPERRVDSLNGALKLLAAGPTADERAAGLTMLVEPLGTFDATGDAGNRLTMRLSEEVVPQPDLATGQLVCTPARAQSPLHGSRPDRVQVTLVNGAGRRAGPYRCSQFLTR
ncbi:hypothetical protein LRS74_14775 [Streptomyces sp. LX-29]|uniref:hypothetical protein n=1 Tax=Streptomyces sp. LX-29 TaxID=2900152 RepID=UPI00240E625C|nr:hypothetical protein [Streptomyces sp. LX-29]WFB08173.1 hypothetical protein LRS74_14775 [Streptomyces sp. LX-29]